MNPVDAKIAKVLLDAGVVDEMQLRSALAQQSQWGGRLHQIVVDMRFTQETAVANAIARGCNVPRLQLAELPPDPAALRLFDATFCEQVPMFPCALRDEGKTLWVAMSDPLDIAAADAIRARGRVTRVKPGVAGFREILTALQRAYGTGPAHAPTDKDGGYGIEMSSDASGTDEDEFKVTDMSGRTMVKHVRDVQRPAPTAPVMAAAPAPMPTYSQPAMPAASGDVFASTPPQAASNGADELLRRVLQNQERTNKVLRALAELCIEKGIFGIDEYRGRMGK